MQKTCVFCCFLTFLCIGRINGFGWTYPSGEILRLANESFDIICTINSTATKGDSRNLTFHVGEDEVSRNLITIINSTSIKLHVEHAEPMRKFYVCKLNEDGVAYNDVIVGFKPGKVSGFKCRSNNWQNLTCTFRQMTNPILTTYNLSFQTTLTMQTFSCPLISGYNQKYSCFLNSTYRPAHETYLFTLLSHNKFGNYSEEFTIDNFASVVLAPPVSIEPKNITDRSVILQWNISPKLMGFRKDIVHQVKICSEYGKDDWKTETFVWPVQGAAYQRKLDHLEYAHTWYDVRIRLRSQKAPDIDEMWSNYTSKTFLTNSRRPDTPPEVDIGGFHINDNRDIVIYWKTLPKAYQNGMYAEYRIRQVFENGKLKNRTPDMSAYNMARFNQMPDYDYEFMVESSNEKGASIDANVIRVPRRAKLLSEPTRLKKLFINGEYKLSWSPPRNHTHQIESYTIFWCVSKNELPNQCESSINFTHVNAGTHSFSFPTNQTINFAVSANQGEMTSGMVWAMCTAAESNDIGKLKTIWIPKMEPTRMVIQWKLECVDSSIVEGYNLTYCPISSPRNIDCKEPPISINITGGRDVTKHEIDDLRPYTTYKTLISMFSKTRMGPESEPLVNTTMESSPTPPRSLVARDVRNSSMFLYWDAPLQSNGVLMYYEIWYNGKTVRVENDDKNATSMVYELQNLTSFTEYRILVLACTVSCSGNSNELNETTKVGVPSSIIQPSSKTVESNGINLQTITWSKPILLAGYIDYYELQIRITKSDKQMENTTVKIFGNYTSCHMLAPICQDTNADKYEFLVRAVNMKLTPHANKSDEDTTKFKTAQQRQLHEVSQEIDDGKESVQFKRHSNVDNDGNHVYANSFNLVQDKKNMRLDEYKQLKTSGGLMNANNIWSPSPQVQFKCYEENDLNLVRTLERDKFAEHLHGEWSEPLIHWCHYSENGYKQYLLIFLAIAVIVCVTSVTYSVFKKYNRMKDIIIILPAGLEDIIKEDAKLGNIDCEMQKKSERIKSKAIEYVDEQEEKLLRTRAESSSSSNTAGEVNSQCSAGDSVDTQRQHSEETASMHSEIEFEEDAPKPFITHPGTGQKIEAIAPNYIDDMLPSSTPIPPTAASSSSSLVHPTNITSNFPISSNGYVSAPLLMRPSNNGYVQHQMMPKAIPQSGYTQVDAFGKPVGNVAAKPETPRELRNMKLNMKTPIIAQTDEEGISGYVTHKQLSDFGHRLQ